MSIRYDVRNYARIKRSDRFDRESRFGRKCVFRPVGEERLVSLLNLLLNVTFLSKIFRLSYFFLYDIKIVKKYAKIIYLTLFFNTHYHLRYKISRKYDICHKERFAYY